MADQEDVPNNEQSTEKLLGGITGKGFMPGQSGNPSGRPKKKAITEMYERLLEEPGFLADLEESVRKMVKSGRMVGQLQLKEMTDRVEGKITQPIEADISVNLADAMAAARKRAGR
ncbi:MAG: DUF5681 domain-containing protein [Gemmatimonadales bacterium]